MRRKERQEGRKGKSKRVKMRSNISKQVQIAKETYTLNHEKQAEH
jgi:hypothetical protein